MSQQAQSESSLAKQKSIRDVLAEPADRTDRELVWSMLAMVVLEVGAAAYVSIAGVRRGLVVFVVVAQLAPVLLQCIPILRVRKPTRYSLGSFFWLLITVTISIVWNLVVIVVSWLSGWWAHGQPVTFDISAAVGLLPLLLGIWKVGSRVRAIER